MSERVINLPEGHGCDVPSSADEANSHKHDDKVHL